MSIRYTIKDRDDIELSDDGKEVEVFLYSDLNGNYYVDIPIEFLNEILSTLKTNSMNPSLRIGGSFLCDGCSTCPFCGGTKTKPFVRYGKSQNCTECDKYGKIKNRRLAELELDDMIENCR